MAQKYFKHFPTIDFDVKNDGNLIQAKDIFRNIRVSSDAEDAIIGYEYYYINDQDRPDVLASKLYGDATLYWLAKMLYAGEDPRFIVRRIVICASEDIGLADSNALRVAIAAQQAVDFIGMPEAKVFSSVK